MSTALVSPTVAGLATRWTWQPLALLGALLLAVWYWRAVRDLRRTGRHWSHGRSVVFGIGLSLGVWTTCGFLQVYVASLFWVWTTQQLVLLLVVPLVVLTGAPLQLARSRGGGAGLVDRFLRSGVGRILGSPLVGPALVPLLSVALFFGPLPGWAVQSPPLGWVLQVLLMAVGALIVLPLVGLDDTATSLAVALSLAIGSMELVLDAIPGIALRLHHSLTTSYFAHRSVHPWTPGALHDQQIAGATLWCVSEVIDLPFLLLVFRRWLKADARDAAAVDAVLEAERAAQAGLRDPDTPEPVDGPADLPWWLSDPAMQKRLHHRQD